uniref:Uncharacterized protein n=1 Tax=Meloidogyne incognita TaxID=6306 RepID=A0A914NHG9_MELIC
MLKNSLQNFKSSFLHYFLAINLINFRLAIHGFPPLIYLTLNKTIREDTRHAVKIIYKRFKIIIGVNNNDNIVHPALVNNYIGHHVDI